jgi:hypothetical protein
MEIKKCPFCGNENLVIDVVERREDILINGVWCAIDIRCNDCKTLKSLRTLGIGEKDCVNEAIRLWNRRVDDGRED